MSRVKIYKFDLFPKFDKKFEENARCRTVTGGIVSVATICIVLFLVFSEVRYFFSVVHHHNMMVDTALEGDMKFFVDLAVYHIPCDVLVVVTADTFGGITVLSDGELKKERFPYHRSLLPTDINSSGMPSTGECLSCFGARQEGKCCQTCEDLRNAYESKNLPFDIFNPAFLQCSHNVKELRSTNSSSEGCRIHGSLTVPRISSSLHVLPGRIVSVMGLQRYDPMFTCASELNFSHRISSLTFGDYFPGQLNPLAGSTQIRGDLQVQTKKQANGRFSYFLQVIPTIFESRSLVLGKKDVIESHQYSATYHYIPCNPNKTTSSGELNINTLQPGVFISYDLSPIKVVIREEHPYSSVTHLILQLCAVCGGIVTVAGLLDALFFRGIQKITLIRKRI